MPDCSMMFTARPEARTSWHHVVSFNPTSNNYLRNLQKGSHVYVEANYELREADPAADPNTPQGQRQILIRHGVYGVLYSLCEGLMYLLETIRLLRGPSAQPTEENSEESS
jgi:hypothetical protein